MTGVELEYDESSKNVTDVAFAITSVTNIVFVSGKHNTQRTTHNTQRTAPSQTPTHPLINPRADRESWLAPSRVDAPVFNHGSWSDEPPT